MKRIWKIFKWTIAGIGAFILAVILVVVLFTGPIAKYFIEHKSEKFTGRIILIDKLKINIFNGKVNAYGLKVYEQDKKTLFVGFKHLFVDLDEGKLLKSVYRVEHLLLEDPSVRILQNNSSFNFDDILKKFKPDPKKPKDPADTIPTRYLLEDLKITGGKITYNNKDYQLNTQLMKTGIVVPEFSWNNPAIEVRYDFILRSGGLFNGDLKLNLNTLEFTHQFRINGFNMAVLYPYLTPYMKVQSFSGTLSLDLLTKGNFNDPQAIAMKGKSGIYDVTLTDEKGKKVAGFHTFSQTIDSLNVKKNIWNFGPVLLDEPYFRFERYPTDNNLSQLIISSASMTTGEGNAATGTSSAAKFNPFVILAGYISDLAKEVIITDYRVRRFSITGGETDYYDHTLEDEFHLNLNHLFFDVQQLNSSMGRASIDFSTVVNKGGLIKAEISVNPKDFMDFDVRYELTNVAVIDYNPYSIFNIAYPFTRGKFNYTGSIVVKNHKIKMDNNVFVEKIYAGKKVKNKTAVSLPVKLALAILRDKKGNITLTVPVEGDLNDPKFKWWKIVVQVLKNLISKAAAAPGNLLASAFGGNEDDFREIKFDYGQDALAEKQLARLENVKKVLDDKPELVVQFNQALDSAKDLEYLTRFEAKKRFYIETRHRSSSQDSLSNEDLININNISITDTGFVGYLDRKLNSKDPMRSTLEKCATLIGKQPLESLRKKRVENRNRSLENYLKTKLNIPENRYAISINSDPKNVPEDNIPRYLISFSVPE